MVDYRVRLEPEDPSPDALWDRIPDEHAIRVGRFMAAWTLIEFKLEYIIWHLVGGDKRDLRRLTAKLDVRPKEETIDELIVMHPLRPEQAEAWAEAKVLIGELVKERTWIVHGLWVPFPFGSVGVQQTAKGGIRRDSTTKTPTSVALAKIKLVTTDDLDGWLQQAREAVRLLNQLLPESAPSP
jgi:hypothetical protein